jgi:hypothetical protein
VLLKDGVWPANPPLAKSKIRHIVLTRFNMHLPGMPKASADWTARRLPVFTQVCLPSLLQQLTRPARWLVGADGEDGELIERLSGLTSGNRWIRITAQDPGESFNTAFERELTNERLDGVEFVLTTRVDCDDAIALDYIRNVERYALALLGRAVGGSDFWISFPYGAQLSAGRYYAYPHIRSHFLTRVVSTDLFLQPQPTALRVRHSRLFDGGETVFAPMTTTPMWLQNVHGQNVLNSELKDAFELQPASKVARLFFPEPDSDTASGTEPNDLPSAHR